MCLQDAVCVCELQFVLSGTRIRPFLQCLTYSSIPLRHKTNIWSTSPQMYIATSTAIPPASSSSSSLSFAVDTVIFPFTPRNKDHQEARFSFTMTTGFTGYDASVCHLSRRCKALCTGPTLRISSFVEWHQIALQQRRSWRRSQSSATSRRKPEILRSLSRWVRHLVTGIWIIEWRLFNYSGYVIYDETKNWKWTVNRRGFGKRR